MCAVKTLTCCGQQTSIERILKGYNGLLMTTDSGLTLYWCQMLQHGYKIDAALFMVWTLQINFGGTSTKMNTSPACSNLPGERSLYPTVSAARSSNQTVRSSTIGSLCAPEVASNGAIYSILIKFMLKFKIYQIYCLLFFLKNISKTTSNENYQKTQAPDPRSQIQHPDPRSHIQREPSESNSKLKIGFYS